MRTEKTRDKGEKEKSTGFSCAPSGISEMITKCCAGRDGFPDCSAQMKGMMEEMKKQHCMPNKDAAESLKRKK